MKTQNWIQLFLLVSLLLFGILAGIYDRSKLQTCSQEGKAVIIDKYEMKSRGYFIKYEYIVNGAIYTKSEPITGKVEVNSFHVGDTIDIIVSCTDHNVSTHKKINNDG